MRVCGICRRQRKAIVAVTCPKNAVFYVAMTRAQDSLIIYRMSGINACEFCIQQGYSCPLTQAEIDTW